MSGKAIITFEQFLQSKGIVNQSRLGKHVLAMWRAAYEIEVPVDQREPDRQHEAAPAGGPDEIQLQCEPGGGGDELTLQAAGEIAGHAAGLVIEAEPKEGKLPTFTMTAYNGGAMFPGGWNEPDPIVIDIAGMTTSQSVPVDYGHFRDIGHTTSVDKSEKSVKTSGVLSAYTSDTTDIDLNAVEARRVARMGKNKFPFQASIAPSVLLSKVEFVKAGETAKANGRTFSGPVHIARQSNLKKIAILSLGADSTTSTTVAATLRGSSMNPFDTWLVANDFDPALVNANPKQKTKLEAQHKAETNPPPVTPQPVQAGVTKVDGQTSFDQKMQAIEEENRRIEHIRETTALHAASHVGNAEKVRELRDLCNAAIEDKSMTTAKFDLHMERLSRANVPMVFAPKKAQLTEDMIQAALCQHISLPEREKQFRPEVMEAADKHFKGGLSLHGLLELGARRNGWRGQSVKSDLRRCLRAAFREDEYQDIHASTGPSTYSISNILSDTTNRVIRVAFDAVESAWRQIALISNVTDYREISTVALTGDMVYKKVAPGGEVKHGTFGDTSYTNKADIYALLIGIDEQDLVNDSMQALTSMSRRVGRGGAITMNQVFWAVWLDDAAFFPTDKSLANYDDGATDSMLTDAGLANMTGIFAAQTDPDGQPLGISPRILLVPPALQGAAMKLMGSEFEATTGSSNIWRSRFRVVSSVYLTNPLAWYLLSDPQDLPAIEMVFLNGQQMPQTETADMAIDRLGIVIRGKHSFGARKQDHRAAVKAKGAA